MKQTTTHIGVIPKLPMSEKYRQEIPLHRGPFVFRFLMIAAMLWALQTHSAFAASLSFTQQLYLKVEKDLIKKTRASFLRHESQLRQYPLYPYLQVREYKLRMNRLKVGEISQFLSRHDNTPVAERMRHAWLVHLKSVRRWQEYREFYREHTLFPSKDLACYYAHALMQQKDLAQFERQLKKLWLVKFSQPPACDRVFQWGREYGMIDDALVWERILLVFNKKRRLADYLAREWLGLENRIWYKALKQARANADATIKGLAKGSRLRNSKPLRDVVIYALRRLSRSEPKQAEHYWKQLSVHYPTDERYAAQQVLGLSMLHRLNSGPAYRLFRAIPATQHSKESQAAQVRAAIHAGNSYKISKSIAALPALEREKPQWQYWMAHSLHEQNKKEQANAIWDTLAQASGYYSFLAADRLNKPYRFETTPIRFTEYSLREFLQVPVIARIQELIVLKRRIDARREFFMLDGTLNQEQYLKLAVLTDRWQWYDGTIRSIARSDIKGDILLRFPLPYLEIAKREAKRYKRISTEMILGVMRRESAFVEKAKSPAGALGLMQLMPATSRLMLRELKLGRSSTWHILRPKTNIRLGTAYLAKLYRHYQYDFATSLAAYNAGSTAVRRWKRSRRNNDSLIWLETIPYAETRKYVRAVLYYTTIYAHRLGKTPPRLSGWIQS